MPARKRALLIIFEKTMGEFRPHSSFDDPTTNEIARLQNPIAGEAANSHFDWISFLETYLT
jgi:hypothetical protein